jgi:hypothetical protein
VSGIKRLAVRRRGVVLLAAILLPALPLGGCSGALDLAAADNVKTGIQQTRHLNFIQGVPFVVKSPEEAQQMMLAKLARDNTDRELGIGGRAGAMTGLFPPGTDLKREEFHLMREQVAGFYDPHDKVMVEVRGKSVLGGGLAGGDAFANELLQAHELTHALQDQHFGLEQMLDRVKNNDDEEIAMHAVMEGDATLAGLGYVDGGLTEENEEEIVKHFAALPESFEPESSGTPLALSGPMMFQYSEGTRFVGEAWKRGGWAAVDELYRDPPWSSQQIIDPALYFEHRAPRLKIDIDGYESALPGWKKADDDTFGELLIRIILERNLPRHSPALLLPAAWTGDHMVALEHDGSLALIWMIVFRDEPSAREFAEAYKPVLAGLKDPANRHLVEARKNQVLVIIGPLENLEQVGQAVWKSSTVKEVNPVTVSAKEAGAADWLKANLKEKQIVHEKTPVKCGDRVYGLCTK